MDFQFSEDEQLILDSVKEFSREVLEINCARYDDDKVFPRENYEQLGDMGMLGLIFPEEYGGVDLGFPLYYAVLEEVSRGCFNTGLMMSVHVMTGLGILMCGSPEQKQKWLPDLITGRKIGAFALSEPDAGTDAGSLRATARLEGDHYVLNGAKAWISGAGEAAVYHVMANCDPSKGSKGITSFLIEPEWPGFSLGRLEEKTGGNAIPLRQIIFEDMKVPVEARMGEEGKGLRNALSSLEGGRIGIAANCTGVGQKALEESVKYAHERLQFGSPLKDFQGLQWMLADMSAKVDASRLLYQKAAWLKQQGLTATKAASTAKRFATDSAMEITLDAVQIHGAYGYTREYPVERLMRYAKSAQIFEGTNQIQRTLISRALFKEMGY